MSRDMSHCATDDDCDDVRAEPGDPCPAPVAQRLREIAASMSPGWPERVRLEALAAELADREMVWLNLPAMLAEMAEASWELAAQAEARNEWLRRQAHVSRARTLEEVAKLIEEVDEDGR